MPEHLSLNGRRWTPRMEPVDGATDITTLAKALRAHRQIDLLQGDTFSIHRLPDLPAAIDRMLQAVKRKEKIAIFGDYDCDGITSTALLARMFRRRGIFPLLRLPHRLHEGYGLRMNVIEEMQMSGITLLLTADTGVSSIAEITEAKKRGMDVIVMDHHHLSVNGLPPADAILHPSLLTPIPPSPPSAAGVVWSFVEAVEESEGKENWEDRDTDVALGAIGTVADLVELRGFNRLLVQEGLLALSRITTGPLALLKMQAGITGPPKSTDIAFRIAPRINAAGRMADPVIALDALLGNEHAVIQLEDWNKERQTLVSSLVDEAVAKAQLEGSMLCLVDPRYVPGICGLIAGKITDRIGRPSLVAYADTNGKCTASLRSVPGYNVTEGLGRNADLLISHGGHAAAAGCSFYATDFAELRDRLSADVDATVEREALVPSLFFDSALHPRFLSLDLCRALQSLEPFGQGNPEPCFVIPSARLTDIRQVGKESTHLQARFGSCKLIGFGMGHLADQASKEALDLAVHLGIDTWQGAMKPQMYVQDVRVAMGVGVIQS